MASEAQCRAEVRISFSAPITFSTRYCWIDGDTLATPLTFSNLTCKLVAKDQRFYELCVADAGFREPMQVGATQTHRGYIYERLAWSRNWLWLFMQTEVLGTV